MNKTVLILIIIFSILIVGIIFLLLFLGFFNKWFAVSSNEEDVSVRVSIRDKESKLFVASDLHVYKNINEGKEKSLVNSFQTAKGYEEFKLKKDGNYSFIVLSNDYYGVRKDIIIKNSRKIEFLLNKKARINADILDNISLRKVGWDNISLEISSNGFIKKPILCVEYGYGIDAVFILSDEKINITNQNNCRIVKSILKRNESIIINLSYKVEYDTEFNYIILNFYNEDLSKNGNKIYVKRLEKEIK